MPLYHGTSSLWYESIMTHGLGGRNLIREFQVLELLGEEILPLQVIGDEVVKLLFGITWNKFFYQRNAICERNILQNLPPQRPLAEWPDSLLQGIEVLFRIEPRELAFEALQVTKGVIIDDADKTIKFQ
jgi:hypothetical protein